VGQRSPTRRPTGSWMVEVAVGGKWNVLVGSWQGVLEVPLQVR
jgi:hypothetical protein